MPDTLGLLEVTASVDCHLRDMFRRLCRHAAVVERTAGTWEDLALRAQRLSALWHGIDMLKGVAKIGQLWQCSRVSVRIA